MITHNYFTERSFAHVLMSAFLYPFTCQVLADGAKAKWCIDVTHFRLIFSRPSIRDEDEEGWAVWFYLHECGDHRGDEVGGDRWVGKCNTVEHLRCSRSLQILVSLEIERKRERGGIGGRENDKTYRWKQATNRSCSSLSENNKYVYINHVRLHTWLIFNTIHPAPIEDRTHYTILILY